MKRELKPTTTCTPPAAAKLLGVSETSLRQILRAAGAPRPDARGRIDAAELVRFCDALHRAARRADKDLDRATLADMRALKTILEIEDRTLREAIRAGTFHPPTRAEQRREMDAGWRRAWRLAGRAR